MTTIVMSPRMMITLVVTISLLTSIKAQYTTTLYMDSLSTCGTQHTIYDDEIVLVSAKNAAASNPPTSCKVTVEAGYTDSYYSLEIVQESISIADCGFVLNIFNGNSINGIPLKSISCTSSSTGNLYSKGRTATFNLRQPSSLYQTQNSFVIRIKAFRDPDAPDVEEGVSHLPVGAIVGMVLGIVVLIAFIILMCWCYRTGMLPGMQRKYPNQKRTMFVVNQQNTDSGTINSGFSSPKKSSPTSTKRSFGLANEELWESMTNASRSSKARTIDSESVASEPLNDRLLSSSSRYNEIPRTLNEKQGNASVFPGRVRGRSQFNTFKESQLNGDAQQNPKVNSTEGRKNNIDDSQVYENDVGRQRKSSPSRGRKNADETDVKRPTSGIFENPDADGYMYEYDHVKSLSGDEKTQNNNKRQSSGMLEELRNEISRRKSLKETANKSDQEQPTVSKETTFGAEVAPGGPPQDKKSKPDDKKSKPDDKKSKPDDKVKALLPEELGNLDSLENSRFTSLDQQSEIGDPDRMQNPMLSSSNPAIRASVNELRPRGSDESPRTKKKKRRRSAKKSIGDSGPRRHKNVPGMDTDTDVPGFAAEDQNEPTSLPPSSEIPLSSLPLPPEAFAPVFATDTSVMQHYYPQQADPYGGNYQPQIIGYDAYDNPVYGYSNQPAGTPAGVPPYTQAGQAAWYVQQTPDGPVTQAAFMMTHTPTPSHAGHHQPHGSYDYNQGMPLADVSSPGLPGFTSTPSNYDPTTPRGRHHSPHHRRKSRSKSHNQPPGTVSTIPGGPMAGTVLDDPSVPPPGMTLVRSGVDPYTGTQTNQVVWSDANRDPTDPVGIENPRITRKTMVRVTTKGTDDGQLPDAPNPALQDMSFNAAQQLKMGTEPAFLSPSKSQDPNRGHVFSAPPPLYATETPERNNAGYYMGVQPPPSSHSPGVPGQTIVHSAPQQNSLIRDKITLSTEEDYEI